MRDYPVGQDDETGAIGQRKVQIVRYGDAKLAGLRFFPQHVEAVQLLIDIEKRGGLIKEKTGSVLSETGRQQDALSLPPAQGCEVAVAIVPAARALHRLLNETVILIRFKPSIGVGIA